MLLLVLVVMVVSCKRQNPHHGKYFQDFENLSYWGGGQFDHLDSTKAHSGNYSSRFGVETDYSYGFSMPLAGLQKKGYRKMRVHAYAMISSKESEAKLILSVEGRDSALIWIPRNLNEFIGQAGKWEEVTNVIDLPKEPAREDYVVKVYGVAWDKKPAWIDDMKVTFIK